MLPFIRNLLGVKTDQAVHSALETLVRWDPKSATEAELRTMEQHLDGLGMQVAEARAAYEREQKEADAVLALSHQRMAAAEQLQQQMAEESDPARKAALQKSLETLVGMLEQMAPDIERERKDAEDAHQFLETFEQSYAQAGAKLKAARGELERAQRQMGRAAQQRDMAERRAEASRQAAGLTSATSGLSVALKAMQDSAAKNLAAAEAANAKATLLQPARPEQDDPNIAAAMAAVSGAGPAPANLSDRLAALRQRGIEAPQAAPTKFLPGSD
jgi:DNA repair exonuclease SbcCD ATPase subunit